MREEDVVTRHSDVARPNAGAYKFPKLRAIESFSVDTDDGERLVLRDPTGYVEETVALIPAAGLLLQFFDGERSAVQIATRVQLQYSLQVTSDAIAELAQGLDELGFLESPAFDVRRRAINDAYRRSAKREARFAGESYPAEPDELKAFLAESFERLDPIDGDEIPAGIVAPHVDLRVAEAAYGHAYRRFLGARRRPDAFVVVGTAHGPIEGFVAASHVPYDTPLGPVPVDHELLDRVADLYPGDLFADEAAHRTEHSVEFQAVYLRYLFGVDVPPMLPVISNSLERFADGHDDPACNPQVGRFVDAVRRAADEQKKSLCFVAGADLAHIGPRFSDPGPVNAETLRDLEKRDRETLATVETGDAQAFYRSVCEDGNGRRICGLAPVFLTMLWADGRHARITDYRQWVEQGSCVSFAAAEFDA